MVAFVHQHLREVGQDLVAGVERVEQQGRSPGISNESGALTAYGTGVIVTVQPQLGAGPVMTSR